MGFIDHKHILRLIICDYDFPILLMVTVILGAMINTIIGTKIMVIAKVCCHKDN